jgi:hypothetical protein
MTKRFASLSEQDFDQLLQKRYATNTKYNDEYAEKLFNSFCEEKQYEYDGNKETLSTMLLQFFACVRRKDGECFRVGGLMTIFHAICRISKSKHDVDIKSDPALKGVREMLLCIKNDLKRQGKGAVEHTQVISSEDLMKIGGMACDTPTLLQLKTWFMIQLYLAKRAMENCHEFKKDDLVVHHDSNGKKFLKLTDKLTKNHRGSSTESSYGGIIMSTENESCPVKTIEKYLNHLCQDNIYFWQKPKKTFIDNGQSYCNMKIGINKISKFMKEISQLANLSRVYTNHSIRVTAITVLGDTFEDTDVAAVSGHKSLTNLTVYKRTTIPKKQQMSASLHNALFGPSTSSAVQSNLLSSSCHGNCCISYGVSSDNYEKIPPTDDNHILNAEIVSDSPVASIPDVLDLPPILDIMENSDEFLQQQPCSSDNTKLAEINTEFMKYLSNVRGSQTNDSPTAVAQVPTTSSSIKNELIKISDNAFVVNGANCVINFNINVSK